MKIINDGWIMDDKWEERLPNARIIRSIIDSSTKYPECWRIVRDGRWYAAYNSQEFQTPVSFWWFSDENSSQRTGDEEQVRSRMMAKYVASGAEKALSVRPESVALMGLPLQAVKVIAALGDDAAVLMAPAMEALENVRNLTGNAEWAKIEPDPSK